MLLHSGNMPIQNSQHCLNLRMQGFTLDNGMYIIKWQSGSQMPENLKVQLHERMMLKIKIMTVVMILTVMITP